MLLSLPVIWVTFAAEQQIGAIGAMTAFPWLMRVSNAIVSYVIYIGKTIFPMGLSVYYPHPGQWTYGVVFHRCLTFGAHCCGIFIKNGHFCCGMALVFRNIIPGCWDCSSGDMDGRPLYIYPPDHIFIVLC